MLATDPVAPEAPDARSAAAAPKGRRRRSRWDAVNGSKGQQDDGGFGADESASEGDDESHIVLVSCVPADVSEAELADFLSGAVVAAAGHGVDGENVKMLARAAPCTKCKIDLERAEARLLFRSEVGASIAECLDGIELHRTRLHIRRLGDSHVPSSHPAVGSAAKPSTEPRIVSPPWAPQDQGLGLRADPWNVPLEALLGSFSGPSGAARSIAVAASAALAVGLRGGQGKSAAAQAWYERTWTPESLSDAELEGFLRERLLGSGTSVSTRVSSHYEVLGVPASAGTAEIRRAYRQKCRELDPAGRPPRDRPSNIVVTEFSQVVEAYRALSCARAREAYDRKRLPHEVLSGSLQYDARAAAFVLKYLDGYVVQRVEVERTHAPALLRTMPGILKGGADKPCGADILALGGPSQPSHTLELLVAGRHDDAAAAKSRLLDHIRTLPPEPTAPSAPTAPSWPPAASKAYFAASCAPRPLGARPSPLRPYVPGLLHAAPRTPSGSALPPKTPPRSPPAAAATAFGKPVVAAVTKSSSHGRLVPPPPHMTAPVVLPVPPPPPPAGVWQDERHRATRQAAEEADEAEQAEQATQAEQTEQAEQAEKLERRAAEVEKRLAEADTLLAAGVADGNEFDEALARRRDLGAPGRLAALICALAGSVDTDRAEPRRVASCGWRQPERCADLGVALVARLGAEASASSASQAPSAKELHKDIAPIAPAQVMWAIVALEEIRPGVRRWDQSVLKRLLQTAALDLHEYCELPRCPLQLAALALRAAGKAPFAGLLSSSQSLLVPAAALRVEVELVEEAPMRALSASGLFKAFSQMCASLANIFAAGSIIDEHRLEVLRVFRRLATECKVLAEVPANSSAFDPEGLCRLAIALAITAREGSATESVGGKKEEQDDDEASQQDFGKAFASLAVKALNCIARCAMSCMAHGPASAWSPPQLTVLTTAFAVLEVRHRALFERVAALAQTQLRAGGVRVADQLWKLLHSAWQLGLMPAMRGLLRCMQSDGVLVKRAATASCRDLLVLLSAAFLLDCPSILESASSERMEAELADAPLDRLVHALDTWPNSYRWRRLARLRSEILRAAVALVARGGGDAVAGDQARTLVRIASADESATSHLKSLASAPSVLASSLEASAASGSGGAARVAATCAEIVEVLCPFAARQVLAPRLESVCAARLLAALRRNTRADTPSSDLSLLLAAVRILAGASSVGSAAGAASAALRAMPAALEALAALPAVRRAAGLAVEDGVVPDADAIRGRASALELLSLALRCGAGGEETQEAQIKCGDAELLLWVFDLEEAAMTTSGAPAGSSGAEATRMPLAALTVLCASRPALQAARTALGPAWLGALLTRSRRLAWDGGSHVLRRAPDPRSAVQQLAEDIAGIPASHRAPRVTEPPVLLVSYGLDRSMMETVGGTFGVWGENHGQPVYRRTSPVNEMQVLLYYWDERDGPDQRGWWFGPAVGGEEVWLHRRCGHTGPIAPPPQSGWEAALTGQVQASLHVVDLGSVAGGPQMDVEDVEDEEDEAEEEREVIRRGGAPTDASAARVGVGVGVGMAAEAGAAAASSLPPRAAASQSSPAAASQLPRVTSCSSTSLSRSRSRSRSRSASLRRREDELCEPPLLGSVESVATPMRRERPDGDDAGEAPPPPLVAAPSLAHGRPEVPAGDGAAAPSKRPRADAWNADGASNERETKLRQWLLDLDPKSGKMTMYFDVLVAEFDADLVQIAAAKNSSGSVKGVLGVVDTMFWETVGVKTMGHRMLFAKGIAKL